MGDGWGLNGHTAVTTPPSCLVSHEGHCTACRGKGVRLRRQPAASSATVPPGCVWGQQWGWGCLGMISKPPRLGQFFAHSSVSTAWRASGFQHPLKEMLSLDLASWYLFPCLRSIQIAGWLGRGPRPRKTCPVPSAPGGGWRQPSPGAVWLPRGDRGA